MKLQEYRSKEIFKKYGIPIPEGKVAQTPDEAVRIAKEIGFPVVIKAQVLVGGRGKAGGIKFAQSEEEAYDVAKSILGMELKGIKVEKVLVTKKIDVESEAYIGITLDRREKEPVLICSPEGGVDIEEVARTKPEAIFKEWINPLTGLKDFQARKMAMKLYNDKELQKKTFDVIKKLWKVYSENDAQLAEINPFVVTSEKEVFALDAKIIIDDNALFKHPELEKMRDVTPDEKKELEAKEKGLSYVKLTGNIGCIVNGAGLAMATMDLIKKYGGEPANFLDIGGSSNPEKVINALKLLLEDKNVKVIFFNIFGGITRCDDVANGIVQALKQLDIKLPIVVRLTGTNEEIAYEILKKAGITPVKEMVEGAKKAIELCQKS